jgi:hypothetical protein
MRRTCLTCPSRVLSKSPHCYACRQLLRREAWRLSKERQRDFTPAQIRDRYIRAVWLKNPAKAQRLAKQAA